MGESAEGLERAALHESTAIRERAEVRESTVRRKRAAATESPVREERSGDAESAVTEERPETHESTAVAEVLRNCRVCGAQVGPTRPDACFGMLPGVNDACCGHGDARRAYIHYESGLIIRGFHIQKRMNKWGKRVDEST